MNAVNRMRNGLLLRVFQGWVLFLQMETRNKQLLHSFGKKLLLRRQFRCLETWKFKASQRKWLRGILNRCLGGKNMNLKSAALRAWKHNAIDLGQVMDLEEVASR